MLDLTLKWRKVSLVLITVDIRLHQCTLLTWELISSLKMKYDMKNKNIAIIALAACTMLLGCSEEFLNRPPQDRLVDVNFYKTDEQVLAGTAPLYSAAWKSYVDKANFKLGDIRGGSVFRAWGD